MIVIIIMTVIMGLVADQGSWHREYHHHHYNHYDHDHMIYRVSKKVLFRNFSFANSYENSGPLWTVFNHVRSFWTLWTIYDTLDYFGPFGQFGPCGPFWTTL